MRIAEKNLFLFRLVVVSRRGPGGGARVRNAENIYATSEDFSFDCTDECAFLRRIERCAVPLHFRRRRR